MTLFQLDYTVIDETTEQFLTDDDVNNVLDSYARGFLSKFEMADRMEFLLQEASRRAERLTYGPVAVDGCFVAKEAREAAL